MTPWKSVLDICSDSFQWFQGKKNLKQDNELAKVHLFQNQWQYLDANKDLETLQIQAKILCMALWGNPHHAFSVPKVFLTSDCPQKFLYILNRILFPSQSVYHKYTHVTDLYGQDEARSD